MPFSSQRNTSGTGRSDPSNPLVVEVGPLSTLAWYCMLVLDPATPVTATSGKTQLRPVIVGELGNRGNPKRELLHAEALQCVLKLLNPLVGQRLRTPFTTTAKGYDFGCRLRAEVTALQARNDPRSLVLGAHVRTILENSLVRWPEAFCRYCGEVVELEPNPSRLLVLLGQATSHTESLVELRAVERAQREVTERIQAWMLSQRLSAESKASTGGVNSQEDSAARSTSVWHFTRRQSQILEHCVELGSLFFRHRSDSRSAGTIKPRLYPLIGAPTGAGKSMLVAAVAQRLNLHYLRVQRGDLAPQGASRLRATVFTILDTLVAHERVLLHLDELDKFTTENGAPTPTSEWGAGIFSDLWSLLDGVLPLGNYLAAPDRAPTTSGNLTAGFLEKRIRTGLWVVGSGTWQSIFSRERRPPIGFGGAAGPVSHEIVAADITAAEIISPELLARFNSDLQILSYPDRDEVIALLEVTGIAALARRCDYAIAESDIDFTRGGFRVIETLYSRLLLREARMLGGAELRPVPSFPAPIS